MRPIRRRGCVARGVIVIGAFVLGLLSVCAATMLVYVVFPPDPVDILLLGVDARPGEGYVTRTDSIMLIGVDTRDRQVSVLSIPRDLFIQTPGYGLQRINTINVLGELDESGFGPRLLSDAIVLNFGVEPDRYARVNFAAFVALVDAVGGVTIHVPSLLVDNNYPTGDYGTMTVRFEPGEQQMDGETALIYARTRYSDDDYRRAERQQQVITALADKLTNPLRWPAAFDAVNRNMDTDLSVPDLLAIAPTLLFDLGRFDTFVINREYIVPVEGGAAPNYDLVKPWMDERFD